MTTQNRKFKLTLLGLVMQGMGLMAHATCGTQSGTDYTVSSNTNTSCVPSLGTTSVTVDQGVTLSGTNTSSSGLAGLYIDTLENLTTLNNSGTILGPGAYSSVYVGNPSGGRIGTLNNNRTGSITNIYYPVLVDYSASSIGTINNQGSITGGETGIENFGTITTINNSGTISQTVARTQWGGAIDNSYAIGTISNASTGVISGVTAGINNGSLYYSTVSIQTITNLGTITASGVGSYGINNYGSSTIGTLNNAQGGNSSTASTTALTMSGQLPQNYNIIITSATHYGQLVAYSSTGTMAFGVSSLSATGSSVQGTYLTVLNGVTNTALGTSGTSITGTSNGYTYTLTETGVATNIWDLLISSAPAPAPSGPSAADTQDSLVQSASALRSVFNYQTALVNNSLNYDCTVFSANGVCVSGGGRFAMTNNITGEQMSTLLVGSYKAKPNMRIGAFIDQNATTPNATGITVDKSPMYGVFGVWNQNTDLSGYEVRLSSSWSEQNITQTRNVVGTSEAGVGTAGLKSQALSGVVSYAMALPETSWIAAPYAGVRKTKVSRGGYTETSAVTTPLTYGDLNQDITTALAGVRMSKKYGNDLYVTASAGVEQNIGSNISTLDASGVTGLTATDFSANYAKTRPVASVGMSYAVAKDQRISFSAMYRKEAFQSAGSTTGLLMYQVGL
jgi:uncharacterized protein YhjY with autotransporter beta-barrel domain